LSGQISCRPVNPGVKSPKRRNNMTPHIPEDLSTRLIDGRPFVIMGNTMPPRDPDEDEEDEDEEEDDEEEDRADEPPVVREPGFSVLE
jgi:hypothetical protein